MEPLDITNITQNFAVGLSSLIIFFGIFVGLFLLTRFFWNWYFKINERVEQNAEMIILLRKMVEKNKDPKTIVDEKDEGAA